MVAEETEYQIHLMELLIFMPAAVAAQDGLDHLAPAKAALVVLAVVVAQVILILMLVVLVDKQEMQASQVDHLLPMEV
jgi:hypothetical protein